MKAYYFSHTIKNNILYMMDRWNLLAT